MTTISYNCKFCGTHGTTSYDEAVITDVAKWIPYLACNTCAEFERRRRDLSRAIFSVCASLVSDRQILRGDRLYDCENSANEKLKELLQKLCRVYQKRFKIGEFFESAMTDSIMQQPNSAGKVLAQISRMASPRALSAT